MANAYYSNTYAGVDGSKGRATHVDAQFELIEDGFDTLGDAVGILRGPATESTELPIAASRDNTLFMFDSSGSPTVVSRDDLSDHVHTQLALIGRVANQTLSSDGLLTYDVQTFVEGGAYTYDGTDEITITPGKWMFWLWMNVSNDNAINMDVTIEMQIGGVVKETEILRGDASTVFRWNKRAVLMTYHRTTASNEVFRVNVNYTSTTDNVTFSNTMLMIMQVGQ